MWKYGQYCPAAHALEILGDRWTLLILRELLLGTHHFNDLERGLPGISRGLISKRLQLLQETGLIDKRLNETGRNTTEYHLTEAGKETLPIIDSLVQWGAKWAFDDPRPEELNSALLMWWVHKGIRREHLPAERVVVQFDFTGAERETYWLVLTRQEVSMCHTDPGFEINVLVTADLATFFKVWAGSLSYGEALYDGRIRVEGIPSLVNGFAEWLAWSASSADVRAIKADC